MHPAVRKNFFCDLLLPFSHERDYLVNKESKKLDKLLENVKFRISQYKAFICF
jgi:hypothetical protein